MCPFKHLLTSQLWTNQSPTGWSTGDGKSHLHRDVKTHSATTKINNQTLHTKAQCFSASLPAIPARQESSCLGEQRERPRKQAHLQGSPCACARTTKVYTMPRDWRPTQAIRHSTAGLLSFVNILPSCHQCEMPNWKGRSGEKRGRQRVNVGVPFGIGCLEITVRSSTADL